MPALLLARDIRDGHPPGVVPPGAANAGATRITRFHTLSGAGHEKSATAVRRLGFQPLHVDVLGPTGE